jgi:hypothetical protein
MPTYLEILPEDIQTAICKHLYSSILNDMNDNDTYRNTKHFHKLLEITGDPLICDLDYLGLSNNSKYDIFVYKNHKIEYEELFYCESAIYQRSHYTKKIGIILDNIEIYNDAFYNIYKANKRYYRTIVDEYMHFDNCEDSNNTKSIYKANLILEQKEPFSCLAELLYIVIDFYNIIKNKICESIDKLETLELEGGVLTQRQRKDKYILEDMLYYHINNRFITRFDYDIDNQTAYPILLPS